MNEFTFKIVGTLLSIGVLTACSPLASSVSKHGNDGAGSSTQDSKSLPNAPTPVFTNTSAPGPSPSPASSPSKQQESLQSIQSINLTEATQSLDVADRAEIDLSFSDVDHESLTPEEFQALKTRETIEVSQAFTHMTVEVAEADVDLFPDGLKLLIKKNPNGRFELSIDSQSSPESIVWFKTRGISVILH